MGVKDGIHGIMSQLWQIAIITAMLAVGVGIGSLLTQYILKTPLNFALAAQLMIIFGAIIAFAGIVFSMVRRPQRTG